MSEIMICKGFRYYYTLLNNHDKKIYNLIVNGISKLKIQISIPPTNIRKVEKISNYIRLDIPEFFYIKSAKMSVHANYVIKLIYEYRFGYEVIKKILLESENAICDITKKCSLLSDYDKVKAIHDYLIIVCDYMDADMPYSHEMPGAILYGRAVCEGISKAFKFIADRVGLNVICVCGVILKTNENHAWNKIQINDKYTNIDVTFDLGFSINNHIRYDYFCFSDFEFSDRIENKKQVVAYASYNYYVREKLFAAKKSDLNNILVTRLKINKWISFQIPRIDISDEQMIHAISDIIQSDNEIKLIEYEIELIPNKETFVYSCKISHSTI